MNSSEPIARLSLHEEITARVRSLIVEGEIEPGERINERALCERFDVSRTPLREALKVLAMEGYVQLTPNRGATAIQLTMDDLNEAFPVMGALEALAGELAVANATDDQISDILETHDRMRRAYDSGDRSTYFALNERIHLAIAEASGNETLCRMQRSLDGRVRRGRYQANINRSRWDEAMAEHEEIAQALKDRDGPRLGRLLSAHLENKLSSLTSQIDRT